MDVRVKRHLKKEKQVFDTINAWHSLREVKLKFF